MTRPADRTPYGHTPPTANNRIREFRLRARLSLIELAAESEVSYPTLQRWETTGKLSVKKLQALADVFTRVLGETVTTADLLPGKPKISDETAWLIERFEAASRDERKAIIKSVRGLTERDEDELTPRPTPAKRR
ncbi:MAG TPA: helix-turn-helix transcriptional regulator [Hyphomonadaceae bacterium]|nr:helix-turn-helix transcriptional regulator [Hyphomonadaceae bacterium]HPI47595.1 helix-turn-helix transcriptional regulator [Hyphomonadaceae bacterium]